MRPVSVYVLCSLATATSPHFGQDGRPRYRSCAYGIGRAGENGMGNFSSFRVMLEGRDTQTSRRDAYSATQL